MRSDSTNIVDLMKTTNGYSIYENDIMINKPAALQSSSTQQQPTIKQTSSSISKNAKTQKMSIMSSSKSNVFTYKLKNSFFNNKTLQSILIFILSSNKIIAMQQFLPALNGSIFTRFIKSNVNNFLNGSDIKNLQYQQQQIFLLCQQNQSKFEKNQELYKKYRNYIIDLGKTQYVSPTMARKGLAGDACAIMRIHKFLQKWGLVNFVHKKPNQLQQSKSAQIINGSHSQKSQKSHRKKKDSYDKERSLLSKIYDKDDIELLKKITLKFRPICSSCDSLCGVSWYEYTQKLIRKYFHNSQIEPLTKVVSSCQSFQYHIKVCNQCFYEKNFPVVLSFDDFTKTSMLSQIKEVDFDCLYGKKKSHQLSRLADVLQKNRFNLHKSSQQLKIQERQLMGIYLQMPIQQYLQKMSRVDVQTQDEDMDFMVSEQRIKKDKKQTSFTGSGSNNIKQSSLEVSIENNDDEQLGMLRCHTVQLQKQEKKIYEQFLQAWLMKMYVKLQQLQKWDKSVQWRLKENETVKKFNLAEKIKSSLNKLQQEHEN